MLKPVKNIAKKILGILLVLVGVLALVTPLTPGSWLAVIGLELLGLRVLLQDKAQPVLNRILNKYPLLQHLRGFSFVKEVLWRYRFVFISIIVLFFIVGIICLVFGFCMNR